MNQLVIRQKEVIAKRPVAFFALDYSSSMKKVAATVAKGYEQCRQEWAQRIPQALFLPAGFHHKTFMLTDRPVSAADLPALNEEKYRQLLAAGSRILDTFETGLQLAIAGKVQAVFVMSDGWDRGNLGNYAHVRKTLLPQARQLGCHLKFLAYYHPKREENLARFIKLMGFLENEWIVFRHQQTQVPLERAMIGLKDEMLKIYGNSQKPDRR